MRIPNLSRGFATKMYYIYGSKSGLLPKMLYFLEEKFGNVDNFFMNSVIFKNLIELIKTPHIKRTRNDSKLIQNYLCQNIDYFKKLTQEPDGNEKIPKIIFPRVKNPSGVRSKGWKHRHRCSGLIEKAASIAGKNPFREWK